MELTHHKIATTKTVGEILRAERKKKNLTLDQAEEETKVRSKYLLALEESRFQDLPASVYAVGFLAKYADFLELQKEPLVVQFSHERGEKPLASRLMIERKIKEPFFSITPSIFVIVAVVVCIGLIIGYIGYSVRNFITPPNLLISSPSAEEVVKEEQVEIVGKTDEGSTLMINNQTVLTDDKGNFQQVVKLNKGLNSFEIRSTNQLKKKTIKIIQILAEF